MKIKVYQIDPERNDRISLFDSYHNTIQRVGCIDPTVYKTVYDGHVDTQDLEMVYTILNTDHPIGYNGHSLSVSDIVEIEGDGCYFCDTVGFRRLENFDSSKIAPIVGHRMLVLEPHKPPYEMVIPHGLHPLQQAVGGNIECTYPFEDNVFVISNDESKLQGLEGNRRINGGIYAGVMLLAADDGWGDTTDLTDDQIRQYTRMFQEPEDITPEEVQADNWIMFIGFG